MPFSLRRILFALLFVLTFLGAGSSLKAYPVNITINVTFVTIPGQSDPLGLGSAVPPVTGTIQATIDSSTPMASYPATVTLTIPAVGLMNSVQSGTLSITSGGQISATFTAPASGSFSATLQLIGLTFPSPVPQSFGTASFSSPASSVHYTLLGQSGVVGVTGTVTAFGLTASPASISANYSGGTAPAPQTITIGSNDPATPSLNYTVAVANASTPFVTLSAASGTTPGTVTATFSTTVAAGTYTANIQVNTAGGPGAPLNIPVTYTVGTTTPAGLQVSPSSLSFQFFVPGSTTSSSQSVSISSSTGSATYTAVASGSFLSVSPTSGAVPGTITVTANASALGTGTFSGSVTLSSPSAPSVVIPVTVTNGSSSGGGGGGAVLSVLPTLLRFSYVIGQPTPPAQAVTVSSSTPVTFTVSNESFYLPVTPVAASAPTTVLIELNPATLTPGSYTDDLTFKASNGATTIVPVIVTVTSSAPAAVLVAAPATLAFATSGTPLSQTLAISFAGSAQTFTATTTTSWLTIAPTFGTTPGSVTVTANPTGLADGSYTGAVTITSSTAGVAPLTVAVTFSVSQSEMTLAEPSLAFAYELGGTAPATQTVTFTTSAAGTTSSIAGVGASWLTVTQPNPNSAVVGIATGSLVAGTYRGALKEVGQSTTSVMYEPVTLVVSATPAIAASRTDVTFSSPVSGAPLTETIAVAETEATTVTVTSDSAWLTATPASLATAGSITATATTGSMAAGIYNGNLTLTSALGNITIPVTLNVGQTAAPVINAVSNGISYENSTGAPGLITAVWGTGLGSSAVANPFFSSNGTQVYADGIPCAVLFSSAGQVNVVLPFSLSGQTAADIQLFYNGVGSNIVAMTIQAETPSVFTSNASGSGGGAILNQDLSVNSATNPAAAGTIVAIYAGGGGETNPLGIDGLIIGSTPPFPAPAVLGTVMIGGQVASIEYYGAAPGIVSGVLQINATIPAGTASGPQPIVFSAGGVNSQPNVVVYVK